MRHEIIFGGKAGQGPNILTEILAEGLIANGYYVFYSREYESLIRGGHNYNTLSFSDKPVYSNFSEADILVCLDDNTEKIHLPHMKKNSIILKGNHPNMRFAGMLHKILGIDFNILEENLKKLKNFEENLNDAKSGFNAEKRSLNINAIKKLKNYAFMNGNQGISKGAILSGLDYYYSYPMTPATPVMMELAQLSVNKDSKHKVVELENEIAVIMAALGSSAMGTKSMVGTSGGGFDLMTEGLSMAGQAELPVVAYLSSRPGPGTGLATYTGQSDLNLALYSGHGEFSRVVIAPGDPEESIEAVNKAFYLSQKYKVPAIVLGDKHLAESKSISEKTTKILEVKSSIRLEKFNSYEHDEKGIATESAELTRKNFDRRGKKYDELVKETNKFEMVKMYGEKESSNLVIGWGSTKGAILDAISDGNLDAKFIQVLFMKPFPSKQVAEEIKKAKNVILVENNATGQLGDLITRKTGFFINNSNKILKYDGKAFFSDELVDEIRRRI